MELKQVWLLLGLTVVCSLGSSFYFALHASHYKALGRSGGPKPLRVRGSTPAIIAEEHHHVLPYWYRAAELQGAASNVTVIHFDTHDDLSLPHSGPLQPPVPAARPQTSRLRSLCHCRMHRLTATALCLRFAGPQADVGGRWGADLGAWDVGKGGWQGDVNRCAFGRGGHHHTL